MSRYAFTKEERETVIRWSEADEKAEVFTASRPVSNKLRKIKEAVLKDTSRGQAGEWFGETWEVALRCVLLRSVPKAQGLTRDRAQALQNLRRGSAKNTKVPIVE